MTEKKPYALEAHFFNPTILREYDIRGIVDDTLKEKDAYIIGASFGSILRSKKLRKVCVGYDGRHSSPKFCELLIQGLVDVGCEVTDLGLGPTPMVYFALKDRSFDASVMVTGSHNPANYNGFKLSLQSTPFYGDDIQELGQVAAKGDFYQSEQEGSVTKKDVKESYIQRLLSDQKWPTEKKLKIAWDAGNGAAGEILKRMVAKLPGEHVLLYDKIDGDFPNHHPDPTVDKNLEDLRKTVKDKKCDFGIAFDGDGDRIGAIDEKGKILRCDHLLILYAKELLTRRPGSIIVGDVKCSQTMFDEITNMGGHPVMCKTGHSLIKAKMNEMKAPLAGELSGHIFFADHYYGFDDALYCAIRLINIIANSEESLSQHFDQLPKLISTPEIRIDVDEEIKHSLPEKIKEILLEKKKQEKFDLITIDGVRVSTEDGWWLVRASNTQNCLVARIEGKDEEGVLRLRQSLLDSLKAIGIDISDLEI